MSWSVWLRRGRHIGFPAATPPPPVSNDLLLESGDYVLLESGDKIALE